MKLEEALQTTKFESVQHKALLNVFYTSYWYRTHVSAVLKQYGLTSEQFNVMRILRGKHPEALCVKNIGSRMIEKSSNVPRIIDRMILKGYAIRTQSPEDRRETLVSLTEKGIEQLAKASEAMTKLSGEIVGLDNEQAAQLHELLEVLRLKD